MSKFVKENFPKAKMVEPEGTYLVWVDFSGYGLSNEELEHLMLEEAKLWLDSGIIFGPETAQFERFNVACPRVTLEQALTQLKDALDKHLAAKYYKKRIEREKRWTNKRKIWGQWHFFH